MKKTFKILLSHILFQFGFDIVRFINSIRGLPRYIYDLFSFMSLNRDTKITLKPCLYDWYQSSGSSNSEYFRQDLHVAQLVNRGNFQKIADIGSRIDGYIANIASFRQIDVFDIRPLKNDIENVNFIQHDFTISPNINICEKYNFVSCLHVIEHFGLGRYRDKIEKDSWKKGIENINKLLVYDGQMIISTPIGKSKVEFNANRIFDPVEFLNFCESIKLKLNECWVINGDPKVRMVSKEDLINLRNSEYSLGIFLFKKDI
jgi:hypothetical protein